MQQEDNNQRAMPTSDLDLNLMLTDSVWGRPEVSPELISKLTNINLKRDKQGELVFIERNGLKIPVGDKNSLWGLLGFYTRDMRLGNLSEWNNELQTCRYMIDLANDLLNADMIEPFLIALSRAATILETSQSKNGFLRVKSNTIRQEHTHQDIDPPKKQLFGGNRQNQGQGGY